MEWERGGSGTTVPAHGKPTPSCGCSRSMDTAKPSKIFFNALFSGTKCLKKGRIVEGSYRVLRGGSWNNNPPDSRVADRGINAPTNRGHDVGFRWVFSQ